MIEIEGKREKGLALDICTYLPDSNHAQRVKIFPLIILAFRFCILEVIPNVYGLFIS